MKIKELQELRTKPKKDLAKIVSDLRKKIDIDYMRIRVGKEKNLKAARSARHDLAQVLTVLGSKAGEESK